MDTEDIIKILLAVGGILTFIGAGLKWALGGFFGALKENTTAVTDSSEKLGKAITDSSTAQVAAVNSLRLELREQRVEVRTLLGMQPPADAEPSDDGEPAPLTPIRGVPIGGYQQINRKGTKS